MDSKEEKIELIVTVPPPKVNFNPDRQEFVEIEKSDLKHYVNLTNYVAKTHLRMKTLFWFIFTFSLGNLVSMSVNEIPIEGNNIMWYIIFFVLLGIGLTGGLLTMHIRKTEHYILAKESNKTYEKKIKES